MALPSATGARLCRPLCGKAQPFRPNGQKEKTKKSLSLRLLPGKPEAFHTAGSKAAIFHTFPANKPTAFK